MAPLSSCTVGNVSIWAPPEQPAIQESYVHRIQHEGESLSLISLWYTGDMKNWKRIQKANPALNAHRIRIGQEVIIPHKLLTNREPLSRDFVELHQKPSADELFRGEVQRVSTSSESSARFQRVGYSGQANMNSYEYRVQDIEGCERFANTLIGLEQCASYIEGKIGYHRLRY